jgi:hypothetical protein
MWHMFFTLECDMSITCCDASAIVGSFSQPEDRGQRSSEMRSIRLRRIKTQPTRPMKIPENEQPTLRGNSQQIRAANLDVVKEGSASPEIKELYQRFREDFGRSQAPGILQCFATHLQLLTRMIGHAESMLFVDGSFGRQNKEMISVFVSAKDCADSHAYSFRVQGGSACALGAVMARDSNSHSVNANERTLL